MWSDVIWLYDTSFNSAKSPGNIRQIADSKTDFIFSYFVIIFKAELAVFLPNSKTIRPEVGMDTARKKDPFCHKRNGEMNDMQNFVWVFRPL